MKIDSVIITNADIKVQNDHQASSKPDIHGRANEGTPPHDDHTINTTSNDKTNKVVQKHETESAPPTPLQQKLTPVFAVDKDKDVVIRLLDEKGKTVKQYPPEEYVNEMRKLHEAVSNLFNKIV